LAAPIILFDGWCVLCNWAVKFLIKYEHKPIFQFAPLDSSAGMNFRARITGSEKADSIIVVTEDQKNILVKGDALMYILTYMKWPWSWFRIFGFLPKRFLDGIYDLIARHRYRIWGKYDVCMTPDEIIRERLLNSLPE